MFIFVSVAGVLAGFRGGGIDAGHCLGKGAVLEEEGKITHWLILLVGIFFSWLSTWNHF